MIDNRTNMLNLFIVPIQIIRIVELENVVFTFF